MAKVGGSVALAAVQVAVASADPLEDKALTPLTGDRVVVGEPGPGREALVLSTYQRAGHRYVVPEDALGPIREGRVDLRRPNWRTCGPTWTFRSRHTDLTTSLPLSAVRFSPDPADAKAGRTDGDCAGRRDVADRRR